MTFFAKYLIIRSIAISNPFGLKKWHKSLIISEFQQRTANI